MKYLLLLLGLIPVWLPAQPVNITTIDLGIANVHFLRAGGKGILIDSGEMGGEEKLIRKLEKAGIEAEMVDYILLTHGHADHAGGAAVLRERLKAKVIAAKAESELLARGHNPPLQSTSKLGRFVDRWIVKEDSFPPVRVDIWVENERDLHDLGLPGTVQRVGGHTEGSLIYKVGEYIFVGDLIRGALMAKSHPRRHFFHEHTATAEEQLRQLIDPAITTIYPGHKGPLTAEAVREYLNSTDN